MKLLGYTFNKNDGWIFILILPYHLLINFLLLGSEYFSNRYIFLVATTFALLLWPVSWWVHTIAGFRVRALFPEIRHTTLRVALSFAVFLLITFVQNCLIISSVTFFNIFGRTLEDLHVSSVIVAGININIMATSVFESTYLINKWKSSISEAESLKKSRIQSELDNLKNQVNPHFLFNSINSLSYLIDRDRVKAHLFLNSMSKVYRYLLQNNDADLTSLGVELNFLDAYFHMLKTRYEDGIDLQQDIPDHYRSYLLPPLTLQMLIENAVKHNVIIDTAPLTIYIGVNQDEQLVVKNSLRKKKTIVASNRIGLMNIQAKYRLLNLGKVTIEESTNVFNVTIPLVKNYQHDCVNCGG